MRTADDRVLDEVQLTLDQLCRAGGVSPQWVIERTRAALLTESAPAGDPARWRFDTVALRRVRRMRHLEQDFDAVPELAALAADLMDEIERLRTRLRRAGLD